MRVSLEGKRLKSFSLVLKTVGNGVKEAMKEHVIDWQITWVSNYKKFKVDTCNCTPT